MASPDSLALLASALFVTAPLLVRYRHSAAAHRARTDEAEHARLTGWMKELRAAGAAQVADPEVGAVLHEYAKVHGQGRHHASPVRPAFTGQA